MKEDQRFLQICTADATRHFAHVNHRLRQCMCVKRVWSIYSLYVELLCDEDCILCSLLSRLHKTSTHTYSMKERLQSRTVYLNCTCLNELLRGTSEAFVEKRKKETKAEMEGRYKLGLTL